jgi:hypothetical protein
MAISDDIAYQRLSLGEVMARAERGELGTVSQAYILRVESKRPVTIHLKGVDNPIESFSESPVPVAEMWRTWARGII